MCKLLLIFVSQLHTMLQEFKSILDLLKAFPTEQDCIDHLEQLRWAGNVVSPFDETSKVYICKGNKYKCKNTGKYFNVKTDTIFDDSKIPLQKWFLALYVFSSHKKGISSHQLAKDITVTQKTAWYMLHRLRYAFDHPKFKEIVGSDGGIVEIDETHTNGEAKNKHASKKVKNAQGNTMRETTSVFGLLERGGHVIATVVPNRRKENLMPLILERVCPTATVCTDEYTAYKDLRHTFTHRKVNHSAKEYVNGMAHTNGIENFWSHLKRGVDGIYHWVSVPHLQAYVDEFSLRFNTRKYETSQRFNFILANVSGRKLTYENLINKA